MISSSDWRSRLRNTIIIIDGLSCRVVHGHWSRGNQGVRGQRSWRPKRTGASGVPLGCLKGASRCLRDASGVPLRLGRVVGHGQWSQPKHLQQGWSPPSFPHPPSLTLSHPLSLFPSLPPSLPPSLTLPFSWNGRDLNHFHSFYLLLFYLLPSLVSLLSLPSYFSTLLPPPPPPPLPFYCTWCFFFRVSCRPVVEGRGGWGGTLLYSIFNLPHIVY